MWQDVSSLDEEIELDHLAMNTEFHDNNISRDISRKVNDIVKKMTRQISNSGESFSAERGSKLPDLKIPIFKGDYFKLNLKMSLQP